MSEPSGRAIRLTIEDLIQESIPRHGPVIIISLVVFVGFIFCIFPHAYDEISFWWNQMNTRSKVEKMRHEMIEATLEERRKRDEVTMIKAAEKDEPKIVTLRQSVRDAQHEA